MNFLLLHFLQPLLFFLLICVKAIENSLVPPTINYQVKDEECDLDVVPNEPRKADIKIAMSNSLGFGGHNASIVLKKYEE